MFVVRSLMVGGGYNSTAVFIILIIPPASANKITNATGILIICISGRPYTRRPKGLPSGQERKRFVCGGGCMVNLNPI